MFPAKLLFLVPHIMQITPSTQQLLHILLPSIWLSLLCSVTILTASRCSWPSPSKGHAYLYLVILGNFNSIDTAHSFCRQDLNCVYLFSFSGEQVWHDIHGILCGHSFDIQDIHILEKRAQKKWMSLCPTHIVKPWCLCYMKKYL